MAKKATIVQQLVIKAPSRRIVDVGNWRTALRSADLGRMKPLFDLYEDLLIDGVLGDAVEKRILAITNAAVSFQDAAGQEVPEMFDVIDSLAFEELITTIMHTLFWGRAAGEFDFTDGFKFEPIEAAHISLETQSILRNANDPEGIPYAGDDHLLVLGKKKDFGLMLKTAPFAIWKRGGFGDYAQWLEIFGMPQRVGKYSSYDPQSRQLLEEALEKAGSAPYIVIPKESEVETTSNTGTGSSGTSYDDFRRACNEEILITVLGQTLTTVQAATGARSLGEVHKEVEESKNKSDMRFVQRVLNSIVLPMLEKRGFPVRGGMFVFPEAATDLTVSEIVQRSDIIDIPASYLHDKYSIPVPDGGEPVARRQPQTLFSDSPAGEPEERTFKERIARFFGLAPQGGAITLNDSYGSVTQILNIDKLVKRALKDIHKKKGVGNNAVIHPGLFTISQLILQKAADTTFGKAGAEWYRRNEDFTRQFKENINIFAAFKNHEQTKKIVGLLTREDGSLRGYQEFEELALKISEKYNVAHLQTEYNTAVRSARMAVNWKKFQESKHLYPNLEYTPSRSAHPRDSHKKLWGKVFAMDDPIWEKIMPPSEWNCMCGIRQTDEPVSEIPADFEWPVVDPALAINPGETASFVKLEETGYYQSADPADKATILIFAQNQKK